MEKNEQKKFTKIFVDKQLIDNEEYEIKEKEFKGKGANGTVSIYDFHYKDNNKT